MIGFIIFLIVAVLFLVLSSITAKVQQDKLTLVFSLLSTICVISSVAIYPYSEELEAELRVAIEANRARIMIKELGSSDNYIRYIEASN